MRLLISFFCGTLFAVGLGISGMTNPAKVLGFLTLSSSWDPSLAFVMVGALIVSLPTFHIIKKKEKPLLEEKFDYSYNKNIDQRLILGSILFGAGWGLGGLCPGPAISSLALLNFYSISFVISMFIGFYFVKLLTYY